MWKHTSLFGSLNSTYPPDGILIRCQNVDKVVTRTGVMAKEEGYNIKR
jgi:hypothetical protein